MAIQPAAAGGGSMNPVTIVLIEWPRIVAGYFGWLPPLVARIVCGWVFLWAGWGKLNFLPQVIENFRGWGIPYPEVLTPLVSGVEFAGGILLLVGLFTRLAAVPLVAVMVVAIIVAKYADIDSLETLLGFEEMSYLTLFLWLAVAGPGPLSLDWLLTRNRRDRRDRARLGSIEA
jgi:putative oxidoreductase